MQLQEIAAYLERVQFLFAETFKEKVNIKVQLQPRLYVTAGLMFTVALFHCYY